MIVNFLFLCHPSKTVFGSDITSYDFGFSVHLQLSLQISAQDQPTVSSTSSPNNANSNIAPQPAPAPSAPASTRENHVLSEYLELQKGRKFMAKVKELYYTNDKIKKGNVYSNFVTFSIIIIK